MNDNDKNYVDMIKKMKSLHRIPRRSLRKKFIKMSVIFTAPIRQSYWLPLQDKIEELTNECFISTATKQSSVENIENLFVGGCRLDENGEAIYDGK